jgi:hypothetical protein
MLFRYSFLSSTYLICPSDRYLQLSVTLYSYHGFSNLQTSSLLQMAERSSPALLPMPGASRNANAPLFAGNESSRGEQGSTL